MANTAAAAAAATVAVEPKLVRLNKLIVSQIGGCSRREADGYIASGWVRVNGVLVNRLGSKVPTSAKVQLLPTDGDSTRRPTTTAVVSDSSSRKVMTRHYNNNRYDWPPLLPHNKTTVILHKPLGVVSCQPERSDQVPAVRLLTAANQHHHLSHSYYNNNNNNNLPPPCRLRKMAVAGRLDVNSTGLLLFTQCGHTASAIIGPDSTVEKEYLVRFMNASNIQNPVVDDDDENGERDELIERLQRGIECSGQWLEAVSVHALNVDQLQIVLRAGKKHHIRRMLHAVGWSVQALKRVRIGRIMLGNLPRGQWRYLAPTEKVQ